jgi:hypothetical protein
MAELYIFLAKDNEFPSWFALDSPFKGLIKVPMSYNKGVNIYGADIFTYKKRKFAGEDSNYKFYLKEIIVTRCCYIDDNSKSRFSAAFNFKCTLKPGVDLKDRLKSITMYYDILVPIWHDFELREVADLQKSISSSSKKLIERAY